MQALAPMLCFQPLGVDRRVLETGGGGTEKENNGIWDMQNKATLSQIQAPTLNIGGAVEREKQWAARRRKGLLGWDV